MKSKSPFGNEYEYFVDDKVEEEKLDNFVNNIRKNVVVQGLGFVGAAMVAALSNAKNIDGDLLYNVIGVDLPDENNYWKIALTNCSKPPIVSTDKEISTAYDTAGKNGNLLATYSHYAYELADIVIVDIHLDIKKKKLGKVKDYDFTFDIYTEAIKSVAEKVKDDVLIIIETTVPPGTTEKVIQPIFTKTFDKRGMKSTLFSLAHSYERVMPGANYYNSIVNYYRVFSGINERSKVRAREFLESFINTDEYPLTELHSTHASEIAKVLENSYRAMNIAFIKEWTEFAESSNVNLFEVIDAIRVRPTHNNIMQPGFGVGGYCLTKDALLADWAYKNHFNNDGHLEMSINAVSINDLMPEYTFKLLNNSFPSLKGKKIIIFGVSYLSDISDTRYSPTEYFYDLCKKEGLSIVVHDPIVTYWEEKDLEIDVNLDGIKNLDAEIAIFTVKHKEYIELKANRILDLLPNIRLVIDANNVINDIVAWDLSRRGIKIAGVGKGHWNNMGNDIK
jgi:UDP-N-acetyl-D-glucosamine dehydrogenase